MYVCVCACVYMWVSELARVCPNLCLRAGVFFWMAPGGSFFGRHTFWGGPPSPPYPPFRCLHQDKKGTNLLLLQIGFHLHTHQDLKLMCCRVMGQKRDTDAHAHMTNQAPITGLHSPTLLPFLQNSTDYLMLAQSCKFGVDCCVIGLTYPAACTRAHVPLTFGHVHRPNP